MGRWYQLDGRLKQMSQQLVDKTDKTEYRYRGMEQ